MTSLTSPLSLSRLTARERYEINLVAQAIHQRYVIPDGSRRGGEVGMTNVAAGEEIEHGRQAYGDALEACRLLHAGRVAEAQVIAARALGHRAAMRVASRQLDQQARQHVGRYFRGEIFSVREYIHAPKDAPTRPFRQWYFRLILVWREDGMRLIVANTKELELLTGMDVGEDGWNDLANWIHEHSNPEGQARKGRPITDHAQLIFRERDDSDLPKLRAFVRDRYPGLVRALSCLRRAMVWGTDVTPAELPDDRPSAGFHPKDWDDDETLDDDEV